MLKGTKLYSILKLKCPRCHKGNLFLNRNPYNYKMIDKMPDNCPVCNQKYWPEPGFYYGAMYVSYALTIAISVSVFVVMWLLSCFIVVPYLIANSLIILILFPPIFRVSRAVWANFFIEYDQNKNN